MKRLLTAAALIIVSLAAFAAKGPDMKYLKKTASTVWAMELPQFNPSATLEGDDYKDVSAAFIASYIDVTADRIPVDKMGLFKAGPYTFVAENKIRVLRRYMVRLNDTRALESFSDFSFRPYELQSQNTINFFEFKEAFGARIHKPGGEIVDVDMSATLTEADGKKGKEATLHKIAIPALEAGDVLEYFFVTDYYMLANQEIGFDLNIMERYPTRNCVINMKLNPELTVVMNTFNGMEPIGQSGVDADNNKLYHWEENDLPAFDNPRWCAPKRQIPYMRMRIADTKSNLLRVRKSALRQGIYVNLAPNIVLAEIAENFTLVDIPGKDFSAVQNIVKNYRKEHPDATENEITDAAWLATVYIALTSSEEYTDWHVIALFKDILDKLNLTSPVCLGVSSARTEVPVSQIASYRQATPLVAVGERLFFANNAPNLIPGEVPEEYAGETALLIVGKRPDVFTRLDFKALDIPPTRMNNNLRSITAKVSIPDIDSDAVNISYTATARGFHKLACGKLISTNDLRRNIEKYLNIPEKLRAKGKTDITAYAEVLQKTLSERPNKDFNIGNSKMNNASITSMGFLPTEKEFTYKVDFNSEGIISPAGDDLLLNIGALIGDITDTKEEKRSRDISIFTQGPQNLQLTISLDIPEGYEIDAESLSHLQANVTNPCGLFFAQTEIDADGNLRMAVNRRSPKAIYPPAQWENFLSLQEAAANFAENSIVLHKKQ